MTALVRCLLALALLCAVPATAADSDGEADWEMRLRVDTPFYELLADGVRVPQYAPHAAPGAPELPFWSTLIELPLEGEWSVHYEQIGDSTWLAAPALLAPAPSAALVFDRPAELVAREDWPGLLQQTHIPDPEIYGADAFYPASPVMAGPEVTQRGRRLLPLRVFPFQYQPRQSMLRYNPQLEVVVRVARTLPEQKATAQATLATAAPLSVTVDGALTIYTGERGIYLLTYEALAAAGAPVATADPASLAMSYLGEPIAIAVLGEEDGTFDPGDAVVFYAEPYIGRYMTRNVYRFAWGGAPGARMARRAAPPPAGVQPRDTLRRTTHLESDRVYYSTYALPRDVDHFFDDVLYANSATPVASTTRVFTPTAPLSAGSAQLVARFHGGNSQTNYAPDQAVAIRVNDRAVGTFFWDGSTVYTATVALPAAWLTTGANRITLEARLDQLPELSSFWVSPDWVEITYPAQTVAVEDRLYSGEPPAAPAGPARLFMPLLFRGSGSSAGDAIRVSGFTAPPEVFDVENPRAPVWLSDGAASAGAPYSATFGVPVGSAATYYATTRAALRPPLAVAADAPSTWRSDSHTADYIAIVHGSLAAALQPLLDHRSAEGWRVVIVDVQDVYDEFSGGRVDPEAIRAFLSYAYHHWNGGEAPPAYVLLAGDGHYDFKDVLGTGMPNLIPPYLLDVDPFIGETAADNRFVSVDGDADFVPDMAIGRIPAKNAAEMTAYVAKVLAYETSAPGGAWQQRTVFAADAPADPAGNFHLLSEQSRGLLPASYVAQQIYFQADASTDSAAEMKVALRAAFDAGAVYLQWFGHASRQRWGSGLNNIFDLADPPKLAANQALPFTAAYSCWSGYFINVRGTKQYGDNEQSLGEALALSAGRGAIADFSPTGLHVGSALVQLNQELVKALFVERVERVGGAVDTAKTGFLAVGGEAVDLLDTQVLLGDPAIRLRLPALAGD